MENIIFRPAKKDETETVLALYRQSVGTPFCTWDETYPGLWEITHDLDAGTLFVLESEGSVIGAISINYENELDDLPEWHIRENAGEFTRVVLRPEYRGKHLAKVLVTHVMAEMKKRGLRAAHLTVVPENLPAFRTYLGLGFSVVGEAELFGHRFKLCEKEL